jgi:hypothetical protein
MVTASHTFQRDEQLCIVVGSFVAYWAIDLVARRIWPFFLPSELVNSSKATVMLGRHTMDVVSCVFFIALALKAEAEPEFKALADLTPVGRTYSGSPTCQLLILAQLSYQAKNLIDSYACGDGAVFYAHHIGTGILCLFGLSPFLHAYAPFFLGHSEISTALLCVLGCLDDGHGVVGLGAMYPKTKMVFAVCFAMAYIPIRCVIWLYYSYCYWLDMFAVIEAGSNSWAVTYSLVANTGLTVLQFVWLAEIVQTGRKEFGSMRDPDLGTTKDE